MKKKIKTPTRKNSSDKLGLLKKPQKNSDEIEAIDNEKETTRIATLNLLEDLTVEKIKVDIARVKEEATLLAIGDGLITTDQNGIITIVNSAAEKLLSTQAKKIIGKKFIDAINMMDEKGVSVSFDKRPMTQALKGETISTALSGSVYYYTRKKIKFPVAFTVTPIIFDEKVIGTIEIFRDITKEKEVDRAKTEFVSLVSHQLRTPLTSVSWYAEMLISGDAGIVSSQQKKYLDEVYEGNKRMIDLVNTLLNVSRMELGTIVLEAEQTDLNAMALKVLDEQKVRIANKKLKIITKFDNNIPVIFIDPKQLNMVLQNLITNAVTYTSSGGRIELATSFDKTKHIVFKISDTGIGIPKNQQNKVFEKFFRADNSSEIDAQGTGLGLYIVKSIVEASNGKIRFESEENKGTTFYVSLPLVGKIKNK